MDEPRFFCRAGNLDAEVHKADRRFVVRITIKKLLLVGVADEVDC